MKSRRRFLGTVGGLGTIAIAGCADSESTSEIELVESDFEADSDSFIGLFGFENESEEEDSIEFSTEVQIGTDGVYGTHRNDTTVTVPGEDSVTEEILLADRTRLSEAEDNELASGYRTITVFIDGDEVETQPVGDQPSRHVSFRVLYDDSWQGAMGEEGSTRTIQGAGNSHLSVSDDAFVVSGNAQKQDDSSDELIVQIIVDGNVIAEEATTGDFGVAQVAAEPSESPLNSPRVPYEPEDVHLGEFPSDGSEQDGTSDEETGESEEDESDERDHEGEPEYTVEGNFPEEAEINEEFTFSMIISNEGDGVGSGPATIGSTVSTDDTIDTQVFFEDEIELQPGETEEIESEPFSWDEPISLQWQVYVESPETGETVDAEYYETEIYR